MQASKARWYEKNKERWTMYRRASSARAREALSSAKSVPCADCGVKYPPYVMDFDHTGEKSAALSRMAGNGVGAQRLAAEMAKCEVVCANCHRERTHRRRNV